MSDSSSAPMSLTSSALKMPPPTVAVLLAAPTQTSQTTSYTIKQLLAYQPHMPSPPSGISVDILAAKVNRPTHLSSSSTRSYPPINARSLRPIPNVPIVEFRALIDSMDSVKFDHRMALQWDASPMMSEACVTSYLDAQVLGAGWQIVLQMLPDERHFDLQMVKQAALEKGVPDQTFSILRGNTCEPLVMVEFKSTGVIKAMLSVIRNAAHGARMDPSDDWNAVTSQIRMYAAQSNTRDIIVMDECVGIYFCFPLDPNLNDEVHDFIFASTELGPDYGDNPRLSLRELVVFALLTALERKNVELRDFSGDSGLATVGPNTRSYRNVLSTPENPPEMNKRAASGTQSRQHPKRSRRHASHQDTFDRCFLGASVKLEFLPNKAPIRGRARRASLDSGFYDNSPHTSPPKLKPAATVRVATLTVQRILKQGVALVTDGVNQFVAKLFPPYSASDPEKLLSNELAVYEECAGLQGTFIPYLHGVCRVVDPPSANGGLVMLTEYIAPGITVVDIVDDTYDLDDEEFARTESRLAKLESSAVLAVRKLHELKVVHRDLAGRNMLVDGEENVVLVDFSHSLVLKDNLRGFKSGKEEDLRLLKKAFELEE